MRVATVDGLVTLFYDGSKELWNQELTAEWADAYHERTRLIAAGDSNEGNDFESLDISDECKSYLRERMTWQQIIIVNGVTEIPELTFAGCKYIKRVIIADTVIRIQRCAFIHCKGLAFIKWSISLEFIGDCSFDNCNLSSVFIPPRCREIGDSAFSRNNITIFNVPQNTELSKYVLCNTKLIQSCPNPSSQEEIDTWLKNINNHENFALHRVCASFEPTLQMIVDTMKERGGPKAFKVKNRMGITPSRYLKENPYAEVTEKEIIDKYTLQMMGEYENM